MNSSNSHIQTNSTMSNKQEDSNPEEEYERVILVQPTVYVYRIPPMISASRGFRADDWNLAQPDWTGRLRVITKGKKCFLRLEDSNTGELYCEAPVLSYPGPQVQPVVDSGRYFVIRVVSDVGRSALIGIGFADGSEAFDLKVTLQDHFSSIVTEAQAIEPEEDRPKLDLSLKSDIRVNLNIAGLKSKSSTSKSRPDRAESSQSDPKQPFLLPPPPGSKRR